MIALGRHIIAELYQCEIDKIDDVSFVEKTMLAAADRAGATVINSTFHHFSPFGVSGVIVIQESHFSIHCWPEFGYASIDIYTCGDTIDPWIAYQFLKEAFGAATGSTVELNRGQNSLLAPPSYAPQVRSEPQTEKPKSIKTSRNIWFTQRNEDIALSLKHSGERLYCQRSAHQKIEVYHTEAFGGVLVLDGKIVCAEEDEYVYHEMIAHVPVFAHGHARRVLVIGGGDGGTVRELLRHEEIAEIDLVEIDAQVMEVAMAYLPNIASSLHDRRVHIKVFDGVEFVRSCEDGVYDIVIVDSDDPVGPGAGLFTKAFYSDIYRILRPQGVMVTQSESPRYNQNVFMEVFRSYRQIFGEAHVHCYLMYLPSFPSGMWSFSFSSKGGIDPLNWLCKADIQEFSLRHHLQYYDFDMHHAAFVLPRFVKKLLEEPLDSEQHKGMMNYPEI
ncbi:MAG: polyamine aminopropyltransferase [Cyclobacteriaceae bacterium]|nr:polyamine aminopropyltransferase [Cyclobacteriaceae bacterium]